MGREEYLRLLGGCDVLVDALSFNAQTTAVDALWSHVPLVTLASDRCSQPILPRS